MPAALSPLRRLLEQLALYPTVSTIAIVVLGRAHPVGAALAALLFGAATALQYLFQASGTAVPYQVFIALPYLLALGVIAVSRRRGEIGDR